MRRFRAACPFFCTDGDDQQPVAATTEEPSLRDPSRQPGCPLLLERGFRPFFLLAGVIGAAGLLLWVAALVLPPGIRPGSVTATWHAHEMIHGYLGAVMAGFLLTAIPNWTARPPIQGIALALLVGLWLLARLAAFPGAALVPELLDPLFPAALAVVASRELILGGNRRNLPVCLLVTGFALADAGSHGWVTSAVDATTWQRLALGCMALLVMLIGGRVTPVFTANWMKREGIGPAPADFSPLDRIALALGVIAVAGWIAAPAHAATAGAQAAAGVMLLIRLLRWRGWATRSEPLVLVLHLAYAWIPAWLLLSALAGARPDLLPTSSALHALTAGALSAMPLAVMTRAILGHTGRALRADRITCVLFVLVFAAAGLRVTTPLLPVDYVSAVALSGTLWAGAHLLFLANYAPMLWRPTPAGPV